jgi:CubicO group peptidase (beta-lactamase class C family)
MVPAEGEANMLGNSGRRRLAVLAGALALTWCARSISPAKTEFERPDGKRMSAADIDREADRLRHAARVPGLAIALIADGHVLHTGAYGLRDIDRGLPLDTDTVMSGASLTKAAFAYMCMQLVQEGRLDLDRPISEYLRKPLPEYRAYRDLAGDGRWRKFTARMLLSHTSGMPNFRWINADRRLDIKFEPGSRFVYSGEGIRLLQFVLEEGLGLDLLTEMQSRVLDRFGMRRSGMVWQPDFGSDYAIGYDGTARALGHRQRKKADAASSLDTTVRDYSAFLAGVVRSEGLSVDAHKEMFRPQIAIVSKHAFPSHRVDDTDANRAIALSYGLGWGLFQSKHGLAFFKEGHDDGIDNYAVCLLPHQRCALLLTNSSVGRGVFKYMIDSLLGDIGLPAEWEGFTPYDQAADPSSPPN